MLVAITIHRGIARAMPRFDDAMSGGHPVRAALAHPQHQEGTP
jgi:hypothetical protein